ncbi:MAG: cbb3-type cytochrome c oxidase subunit II [Acidobacteria bacterium]|nr:cbb3-type cytochrome c oxidase subunit II [Acidobacteriota bacterium]
MTSPSPPRRDGAPLRAVVAVAATYVYFLLFAQFGFLHLLAARGGGGETVQASMLAMGGAGLLASLLTGWLLGLPRGERLLPWGFLACAASALFALSAPGSTSLLAAAAAVGASTAVLTVSLAASLGSFLPGRRYGLMLGLGTGLAYGLCNLPWLFEGSYSLQVLASAGAALLGFVAVRRRPAPESGRELPAVASALGEKDFRGLGFVTVVASFLALVWLDSAAFAVIQETLSLKGLTWGGESQLLGQGATHFLAAVAAGWAIDRGIFRGLLPTTFALFLVAFTLLQASRPSALAGPLYAVGISFYSVALVAYPALAGDGPRRVPVRWRSALLYGIAGWIGSALGVGMAQDLHRIPTLFLVAAGGLLFAAWGWSRQRDLLLALRRLVKVHGTSLALAAAVGLLGLAGSALDRGAFAAASSTEAPQPDLHRGREVYIAEGCIHCHSQYVRPSGADAAVWGPHRALDRSQAPPLPGNRRQGPDLSLVGTRRSPAWNRQHLRDPRSVTPGSLMPAYGLLFAPGDRRGEDLVAYLGSLGTGAEEERWRLTRTYRFQVDPESGHEDRGQALFGVHCSPCHGPEGRGDGPMAEVFYRPAMNLRKGSFWAISWGAGAEPLNAGIARVIKFGIPGTSMPGHEWLSDRQVVDLAAHVRSLASHPDPRGTDDDLAVPQQLANLAGTGKPP